MQAKQLLDDLTEAVLEEIGTYHLGCATQRFYRQACCRFKVFARARGNDCFSEILLRKFLEHLEENHQKGTLCKSRRDLLRRVALLLKDYATTGKIEWKHYSFKPQRLPAATSFLRLYADFLDHLRFAGKSDNTIQSAQNAVRQFLLFLEDCGCRSLSLADPQIVPSFFQHLLSTYRPTSIRTVASNIRSFLRYAGGGDRLLPAVPWRCVRAKTTIPILDDQERDALVNVLKTGPVSLRDNAIILLALRTGLRAIDIVKMKLGDIDWRNDTISIRQAKTMTALIIPLTAEVGNALSAYILRERPPADSPCVFLRIIPPFVPLAGHTACYALVRKVFRQAGIRPGRERKGTHVLRHSAASRMLAKGVPVTTISTMLGHSDKSSTDVYLQTDEARMRDCALGLDDIPMTCGGLT